MPLLIVPSGTISNTAATVMTATLSPDSLDTNFNFIPVIRRVMNFIIRSFPAQIKL